MPHANRDRAHQIRLCGGGDFHAMLTIINEAAIAYRGVIPDDRWHEPYMSAEELRDELETGVIFWGLETGGELAGVMGIQAVRDVDLIRNAYVSPRHQRRGVGGALIGHLRARSSAASGRLLVGTWADAVWAIDFYRRNGFELVDRELTVELLRTYWTIPDRQIETSVVLASPPVK